MEPFGRVALWALLFAASACGRTDLDSFAIVLAATTDLTAVVRLTWTAAPDAARGGFRVVRDGGDVATVSGTVRGFDDVAADPGHVSAPEALTATEGTRSDGVELAWSAASATSGRTHTYRVIALDESRSPAMSSNLAAGARAAPMITGYEVARDDGDWSVTGPATTAVDGEAPLGAIVAEAEATPRYPGSYTRLRVVREPTITPAGPTDVSRARGDVRRRFRAVGPGDRLSRRGGRRLLPVGALDWRCGRRLCAPARRGRSAVVRRRLARRSRLVLPGGHERQRGGGTDGRRARRRPGISKHQRGRHVYVRRTLRQHRPLLGTHAGQPGRRRVSGRVVAGHVQERERGNGSRVCASGRRTTRVTLLGAGNNPARRARRATGSRASAIGCGVRLDDKVVCWGDNARGEAPPGPSADSFPAASATCAAFAWMGGWSAGATTADGGAPPGPSSDRFKSISSSSGGFGCGVRSTTRWSAGETTRTARRPPDRWPIRSRVFQRVPRSPAACAPTGGWSAGEIIPTARRLPGRRPTCSRAVSAGQYGHGWLRLRGAHR